MTDRCVIDQCICFRRFPHLRSLNIAFEHCTRQQLNDRDCAEPPSEKISLPHLDSMAIEVRPGSELSRLVGSLDRVLAAPNLQTLQLTCAMVEPAGSRFVELAQSPFFHTLTSLTLCNERIVNFEPFAHLPHLKRLEGLQVRSVNFPLEKEMPKLFPALEYLHVKQVIDYGSPIEFSAQLLAMPRLTHIRWERLWSSRWIPVHLFLREFGCCDPRVVVEDDVDEHDQDEELIAALLGLSASKK